MRFHSTLAAAVVLTLSVPVTAAAQNWRFDLGVNGGGSWLTSALDEDHLGIADSEVEFDAGWLAGAQGTLWLSPRFGLRANFGYSDRPLVFDGDVDLLDDDDLFNGGSEILSHVNLWTGTGDLMLRFAGTPASEYIGAEFLPYLSLGLGAKWVNAAGEGLAIGGDASDTGVPFTLDGESFFMKDGSTLLGRAALGSDLRVSRNLAFRLEAGDMMWDAPFERVAFVNGNWVRTEADGEDVGKLQHELYASAGLHLLLGVAAAEPVAVLPPPPPPAAPQPAAPPAPRPEPAPVEEDVTLCVIDPAAPGGTMMATAVYRPATRDTLVVRAGERLPVTEVGATVRLAGGEDWYITGRPFVIEFGNTRSEFIPYGNARTIDEELVVLGTVNGLTVYAEAEDAMAFRTAAGSALQPTTDLGSLLTARPELRTEFGRIERLYVPTRVVGCEFGPLQRLEDVRKNRN